MKRRSTAPGRREACTPPSAVQITIDRPQPPFLAPARGSAPPAPLRGSRLPAFHPPGSAAPALPAPSPWQRRPLATRRHGNGEGRAGSGVRLLPAGGKMAAGAAELQRLQWRLEELEQLVGGAGGAAKVLGGFPQRARDRSARPGVRSAAPRGQAQARRGLTGASPFSVPLQVADELVKVQVALSNIAGKKERIKILFKKSEWVRGPRVLKKLETPVWRLASLNKIPFSLSSCEAFSFWALAYMLQKYATE